MAAADSDARLEQKLAANTPAFAALTVDAAAVQMPRLQVSLLASVMLSPVIQPRSGAAAFAVFDMSIGKDEHLLAATSIVARLILYP